MKKFSASQLILRYMHRKSYREITLWALVTVEILFLSLFSSFLLDSLFFPFALAALFITVFAFWILQVYESAGKENQLLCLKTEILALYVEKNVGFSQFLEGVMRQIQGLEYRAYPDFSFLPFASSFLQNRSFSLFWSDILWVKQQLYQEFIATIKERIKKTPFLPELHQSLVEAYLQLFYFYTACSDKLSSFTKLAKEREEIENKKEMFAEVIIQECNLLRKLSHLDSWPYWKMIEVYKILELPEEELQAYEALHKILPENKDIFFERGRLYFLLGKVEQGLQVYEILSSLEEEKAHHLLAHYTSMAL